MPSTIHHYRLKVSTRTALQVGTTSSAADVSDGLFRRDSRGRLMLPGSSIAGALRGHLTRIVPAMTALGTTAICDALTGKQKTEQNGDPLACGCIVCHLMGDIRPLNVIRDPKLPPDQLEKLNGRASRLIIHDALFDDGTTSHIRDGVGIDRTTGASARAASAKFDSETIPAGTPLTITLELEDADPIDLYLMALIFAEWQSERIRFGGSKSRGTGTLSLVSVEESETVLTKPPEGTEHKALMQYLRRRTSEPTWKPRALNAPVPAEYHGQEVNVPGSVLHWLTFEFDLQAQGFFLTNDTTRAVMIGTDHRSLVFLPGSSLRGAIRSQAERIARTIANMSAENEAQFLARCAASNPFVTVADKQHGIESSVARIRRHEHIAALREDPMSYDLAEQLFGSVDWGSRLVVDDAPLVGDAKWKKLDFVAIDRFTGGAADGAKFDAYALWQPRFRCRLHLESPEDWEIGWLLATLADLADGRVPVGMGASKGFGDVRLDDLRLTWGAAYPTSADADFFTTAVFEGWDAALQGNWVNQWIERVRKFEVAVGHSSSNGDFNRDPYWGTNAHTLYRKETNLDVLLK